MLSPSQLARAKSRARAAGRPYPNAFDNMVAGGAKWREGVHKGMAETARAEYAYRRIKNDQRRNYDRADNLEAKAKRASDKSLDIWAQARSRVDRRLAAVDRIVEREEKIAGQKMSAAWNKGVRLTHEAADMRKKSGNLRSTSQGSTYALNSIGRKYGVGDTHRGIGDSDHQYKWAGTKDGGPTGLIRNVWRHRESQKIKKNSHADDLELPQQLTLGIPVTRFNPISPLVMLGSSSIMADAIAGAMGRNLSRRERKHVREQAYRFTSANGMLYSPVGYGVKGNPQ